MGREPKYLAVLSEHKKVDEQISADNTSRLWKTIEYYERAREY